MDTVLLNQRLNSIIAPCFCVLQEHVLHKRGTEAHDRSTKEKCCSFMCNKTIQQVMAELEAMANPELILQKRGHFGITVHHALGVYHPNM